MIRRGAGLIPDDPGIVEIENQCSRLIGSVRTAAPRPSVVDYRDRLDRILDQGATNACVGCALSTAVYLRGQVSGEPVQRPSAKAIYDMARLYRGPIELVDEGCRPLDAIAATQKHGLVDEQAWPLFTADPELMALVPRDARWIDTPPDFTVFHQAADAVLEDYDRADLGDVVATLEAELAAGEGVLFAMRLASDFEDVRGDEVYDAPSGPPGATSHMQAICGYDEDSFLVVSSWGKGHGNDGIVRVAKRFIADPAWCFARMVIKSGPAAPVR